MTGNSFLLLILSDAPGEVPGLQAALGDGMAWRGTMADGATSSGMRDKEAQRAVCEQAARAAGREVVEHLHDEARDRSALHHLSKALTERHIDTLVVSSVDRLAHKTSDLHATIDKREEAGVTIRAPQGECDYNSARLLATTASYTGSEDYAASARIAKAAVS